MTTTGMSRRDFLASLLRSRPARIALVIAVAGLFVLAAYLLWQGRTIIAIGLIVVLFFVGFDTVMGLIPWPEATRARMERRRALNDRYPSHRYQWLLWIGVGGLVGQWMRSNNRGVFAFEDFVVPLIATAIGLVAMIIWKTRHAGKVY